MILAVDDDPQVLAGVEAALAVAGMEVRTASDPARALELLAGTEPELIISDVMMPGMDGFAFKAEVESRWPNRLTPFLYLSSLADPAQVIRGLDAGAWDYLTKPFNPGVLTAKVRSILATRSRFAIPSFRGNLADLPLGNLLEFARRREVTGELEIEGGPEAHLTAALTRGALPDADRAALEARFPEGTSARFVLRIPPPDWSPLLPPAPGPAPATPKPVGRLSGVRLGERIFSLQTEVVNHPKEQVVTIVVHNGRVMQKRAVPAAPDPAGMERQIEEQHRAMEEELREKVAVLLAQRREGGDEGGSSLPPPPSPPAAGDDAFARLQDAGFERYREGDLRGALAAWEEAARLQPDHGVLTTNIRILRAKLERDAS
jgi:DNA-binding response OmpR family regulator